MDNKLQFNSTVFTVFALVYHGIQSLCIMIWMGISLLFGVYYGMVPWLPNKVVWDEAQRQGKPVIVLEVGGIKRGITWKVGLNGINREANFRPKGNDDTRVKILGLELKLAI